MHPLEQIHIDVIGLTSTSSLADKRYGLDIVDYFTAKSDVLFLERRSELSRAVSQYMARAESETGHILQKIRLYGAGEHRDELIRILEELMGFGL